NDAYSVDEDATLTVAAPGVLTNDSDLDGDSLTAVLVTGPTHTAGTGGSFTLHADGSFSYHADDHNNTRLNSSHMANDEAFDSPAATLRTTLSSPTRRSSDANDAYSVDEDATLTVAAPGVLTNDSDLDGDSLTAVLVTGPTHTAGTGGSFTLHADGSFSYHA